MNDQVYQCLAHVLAEKHNNKLLRNEEAVRSALLACIKDVEGVNLVDVHHEFSHPLIHRANIDLLFPSTQQRNAIACEIKYDRRIPSDHNAPRTQKAGSVFRDIMRLALFKLPEIAVDRCLIYCCDDEMAGYFQNHRNKLTEFFSLGMEQVMQITPAFIDSHAETFVRTIGQDRTDCTLQCRFTSGPLGGIWLRVYAVYPELVKIHPG